MTTWARASFGGGPKMTEKEKFRWDLGYLIFLFIVFVIFSWEIFFEPFKSNFIKEFQAVCKEMKENNEIEKITTIGEITIKIVWEPSSKCPARKWPFSCEAGRFHGYNCKRPNNDAFAFYCPSCGHVYSSKR